MFSMTRRTRSSYSGGIGSFRTMPTSRAGRSARAITSTRIWQRCGSTNRGRRRQPARDRRMIANLGTTMRFAAGLFAALGVALPAAAEETPKHGGILTYMIPADAPPSFDAHREVTYATIHSAAPFYSTLVRINPYNPGSTTDFVCDLCTEMPTPTDGGKTYTFKIRNGVKFHDGAPLSAADVLASWNKIIDPPEGVT